MQAGKILSKIKSINHEIFCSIHIVIYIVHYF